MEPIHVENRKKLVARLREELVGPSPQGEELDCAGNLRFDEAAEFYKPWRQAGSGEEILQRDPPGKRYGVGVLYPLGTRLDDDQREDLVGEAPPEPSQDVASAQQEGKVMGTAEADTDDFDLSPANAFKPSSMGVSFLAIIPERSKLVVTATGGRYHSKPVLVEGKQRTWWLRIPVNFRAEYPAADLTSEEEQKVEPAVVASENAEGLDIKIEVYSRPYGTPEQRLMTVTLVNRKPASSTLDEACLFQAQLTASVQGPHGESYILPYPDAQVISYDEEEESLNLLYRDMKTYAVGHGCAANWGLYDRAIDANVTQQAVCHSDSSGTDRVGWVSAESLPEVEVPSITPDINAQNGQPIEVSMAPLAGLVPGKTGLGALQEVVDEYMKWIEAKEATMPMLAPRYRPAARRNLALCRESAARMKDGLAYLIENPKAFRAFQLANRSILLQQVLPRDVRPVEYFARPAPGRLQPSAPYQEPDPLSPGPGRGKWRAFQIAFLLMAVRSAADGECAERDIVDLIWFPTGGGKTEAYLGLAAFSMFMRRLCDQDDIGVQVLMRYTLRLLTAQQFQRAARLVVAMEYLRRQYPQELGNQEFSIGIWLGGDTTPNSRQQAVNLLRDLTRGARSAQNKFLLGSCPWCGCQMGPLKLTGRYRTTLPRVIGYEREGQTVVFRCFDQYCPFSKQLPVYVIDEEIYDKRPSLVIGTVDKFAMLAWNPKARALFGIDNIGKRVSSPPGLIIQDELHLISGPLGSMVGLYETVIEELCTDRRGETPVPPKIIASTATIRRYAEQIKALYSREKAALFPAPGLEAGDSFFARYAYQTDGTLAPGRLYVGVHAPGLGSMQTAQVRTFTSLLQSPMVLPEAERDPWWTLLIFFNSLRELGTSLTLFQSDIRDYFMVVKNRLGLDYEALRAPWNTLELTGRLRSDEVPKAIEALEIRTGAKGDYAVDACLASNIIEVGIDIDRLSLMSVVGQPKTTSQYIQVTGRVGRRWWEQPGLVVTLYSASKPRDRSHFEKFRSYHERLYAQVEPTSVTPFSPPVLDRALHAVMVAYVRQQGALERVERPYPYPQTMLENLYEVLLPRVQAVDPTEMNNFRKVFEKRKEEWKRWEPVEWGSFGRSEETPLLVAAGAYVDSERIAITWPTPMSMRNVDAECRAEITRAYITDGNGSEEAYD
jgi:hypothetical protein